MTMVVDDVLHFYPDHPKFLNDKGALLAIRGKWSEALKLFLRLHKLDKEDEIVISNIAHCYRELNKTDKAVAYYRQLLRSVDRGIRQEAESWLRELGKEK